MFHHERCHLVGTLLLFLRRRTVERRVNERDDDCSVVDDIDLDTRLVELRCDLFAQGHTVAKQLLLFGKLLARCAQSQGGEEPKRSFEHVQSVYNFSDPALRESRRRGWSRRGRRSQEVHDRHDQVPERGLQRRDVRSAGTGWVSGVKSTARRDRFAIAAAFAPFIFVAHVLEEAPGFVRWLNAHVSRGITSELFWQMNISALVITVIVSTIAWLDSSAASALAAVAWLGFLMGANSLVHIAGSVVDGHYVPGLATALLLYIPYYGLVLAHARRRDVSVLVLLVVAIVSATPMLIHGYRIIFLGTRLF